jgi:hypothetical protein
MTAAAKIALSDKELELVCTTDWILTKHRIIQKVYELFGEVLPLLEKTVTQKKDQLPGEIFMQSAKISKGENYELLPWVMLDYPRHFGKTDTIAIRTFFWWGHFFSVCLQLSGNGKVNAEAAILQQYEWLQTEGYFICVNENPWEHHFENENFIAINQLTKEDFSTIVLQKSFVKIAQKIAVEEWERVPGFIINVFTGLTGLLQK